MRTLVWGAAAAAVLLCACPADAPSASSPLPVSRRTPGGAPLGVRAVTATTEARDGAAAAGELYVLTPGGILGYHGETLVREHTFADGLPDASIMLPWGKSVVVGSTDGSLTFVGGDSIRFTGAPVADLAVVGDKLWIATRGAGLFRWDGSARHVPGGESDLTALAAGPAGLAVGGSSGAVYVVRDARLAPLPAGGDRVTALAWEGERLWVGRAFALDVIDPTGTTRVRTDLPVMSLLAHGGTLYVGTDAGAVALAGGRERRVGAGRVGRIRLVDGVVVAFGDDVFRVDDGAAVVRLPRRLSATKVTALLRHGADLWVGTAAGVDVLDPNGTRRRHLGGPAVTDLVAAGANVLAGTRGGLAIARDRLAVRHVPGEAIAGVDWLAGSAAVATPNGIRVVDEWGAVRSALAGTACTAVVWGPGARLTVGTADGLVFLDGDLSIVGRVAGPPISALALDVDGVYAGTERGVRLHATGGGITIVGPETPVRALLVDGDRLLIGSDGSLRVGNRVVSLPGGRVTSLAVDEAFFWVGTEAGLLRIDRGAIGDVLSRS